MKANQTSATAYLIAESAVYLSQNKITEPLLKPETVELCRYFADERALGEKLVYLAKRQRFFRPLFNGLENLVIPGIQLHYTVRKRRLEEIALEALADKFRQVVVFGAGFDTLALRLHKNFPAINFIEIDYPSTQTAKINAIEKRKLAGNNLKFIALDLTGKSFSELLLDNKCFCPDATTLFIAEGLLMYLKPEEVNDLFDFVRENSLANSRFAFTFMQRQTDGRVAFQNSSKLVDFWLKIHGEPFLWGLKPEDLDSFLEARNFSLQSLDSAETFRQRYLNSPQLKRLTLAQGELLCVAETRKNEGIFVNDVHSKLNKTRVAEFREPQSVGEIQAVIKKAEFENKSISVAGGFHAMGGQQFLSDGILLDMKRMNRVLKFDPDDEFIEVEAGIRWNALIDFTIAAQTGSKTAVGIRQKQTGADNLSVGGALAANIHGRGLLMKPFINDIESFRLINADGEILNCSRWENAELFRLAIGGYGLFGIVATVRLRLSKRQKLQRFVYLENLENLNSLFKRRIEEKFLYGDFQFAVNPNSEDFLNRGVFSCYLPVSNETPVDEANRAELAPDDWKNLLYLAHDDKQKAFELYAAHYLATDGQIYWSDTHQLSVYLDNYHLELDKKLNAKHSGSEMITEVYVPLEKLAEFMRLAREDFRRGATDLIYGTIRLIKRDEESFLAWAREDFACIVFNLHVEHSDAGIEKAKAEFKQLIDRAIGFGGSFYLTYHRWATKRQILSAYPQMPEFLRLKKKFDSREIFQSDWYRHQKNNFGGD